MKIATHGRGILGINLNVSRKTYADFDSDGKNGYFRISWKCRIGMLTLQPQVFMLFILVQVGDKLFRLILQVMEKEVAVWRQAITLGISSIRLIIFTGIQLLEQQATFLFPEISMVMEKQTSMFFRPSTGFWYRLNSSNGQFVCYSIWRQMAIFLFEDYDGDGKADILQFFRPSDGLVSFNSPEAEIHSCGSIRTKWR